MLTRAEKRWISELQAVLDKCPSKRLGFYTTGDPYVAVIDQPAMDDWERINGYPEKDYCCMADTAGTKLAELKFPNRVHSTAG